MRVKEVKQDMIRKLSEVGIENPSLEAFLLIEKFTGLDRTAQLMKMDDDIEDITLLMDAVKKRISGIPMAYILGHREFYGLDFFVDEDVLIPRADTETLVEEGISFLKDKEGPFLDLCTGSGCVGISVSHETGNPVVLVDLSEKALEVAKRNAENHIKGNYEAVQSDLFSHLGNRRFKAILTNPPYLTDCWYEIVTPEVKKEPKLAFLGFGDDGLDLIRKIIEKSPLFLEKNGLLAIECDYRQTEKCARLLEHRGFMDIKILKDLAGLERCVRGIYPDAT
ncbi:MAG: peptide chain release factor N(5)-glutamine methyltransferase [Sphaerochaetaceae bacterium]|nr:peptide chain release factor N(5)-glutamine methyltransferase [Sphaerochaetaceae bacterium]